MNRIVPILVAKLFVVVFSVSVYGNDPPGPFSLLEPADGTHLVLTDPLATFSFEWEDVLKLGEGGGSSGPLSLLDDRCNK